MEQQEAQQRALEALKLGIKKKEENNQQNQKEDVQLFQFDEGQESGQNSKTQEQDQKNNKNFQNKLDSPYKVEQKDSIEKPLKKTSEPIDTDINSASSSVQHTGEYGRYSITGNSSSGQKNAIKPKKIETHKNNNKVTNILNDDQDIGEVGEWVDKSAAQQDNQQEDDGFDAVFVDIKKEPVQEEDIKIESKPNQNIDIGDNQFKYVTEDNQKNITEQRQKIQQKLDSGGGTTLGKRQGPIVNNLKEKAKSIALQNTSNVHDKSKQEVPEKFFSDNEGEDEEEQDDKPEYNDESPDRKIFKISNNSLEKRLSRSNIEEKKEPVIDSWAMINEKRLKELQCQPEVQEIQPINFIDAWDQIKQDKSFRLSIGNGEQAQIKQPGFLEKYFGCFSMQIKKSKLIEEKNQIFKLVQLQYDDQSQLHFRIIHTIYRLFVNSTYCQRYGPHWENIGFQGRDPATDFRGAGMLGVLQILAFLGSYKEYIRDCLEYSKTEGFQFPLCIALINITTFCIICLKENRLNNMIKKEDSVMSVINKVYFAAFYNFFTNYKRQQANFHDIGNILKSVGDRINMEPAKLVQEFNRGISLYYKQKDD